MPVTCPKCGRPIAAPKQWHYCGPKVDLDSLFERKVDNVLQLFDRLLEIIAEWPEVQYCTTKACIVFVARSTFLIVRPMKAALDLHFALSEPEEDEAVYKCVHYKARHVHYIRLYDNSDLSPAVLRLIRKSYEE